MRLGPPLPVEMERAAAAWNALYSESAARDYAARYTAKEPLMPDKTDTGGQPTLEKLAAEGVPIRKCIAMGESYGNGGAVKAPKPSKSGGSAPMRTSKGGGY